jgi:hypothetical protein
MTPLMVLIATAAVGIEVGWQPLPEGGHEYTIQIEPQLLRTLETHDITSEVPPQLNVRRYRITLGSGKLSRIDGAPTQSLEQPQEQPTLAAGQENPIESPSPDAADESREPKEHPNALTVEPEPSTDHPTAAGAHIPANFTESPRHAKQLENKPVGFDSEPQGRSAEKPTLSADPSRPWLPFLIAAVLLSCSLGANIYLGWIAWDARSRYRNVVATLRPAPAS